jgi:signal transduction histidine kinase/response regulator of citrate/malate metabolism
MTHVKINILVVEDNLQDFVVFKEILGQIRDFFIHVEHAQDLGSAIKLAKVQKFDIVFLDLFLPDSFGQETFTRFQAENNEVPVVVLSGLSDKNIALEIVNLGAQDYIVKGEFDGNLLEKAIIYSIERKKYQDRLRSSEEKYRTTFEAVGVSIVEYDYTALKRYLDNLKDAGVIDPISEIKLSLDTLFKYEEMVLINSVNPATLKLYESESVEDFVSDPLRYYIQDTIHHIEEMILAIWNGLDYYEGEAIFVTSTGHKIVTLTRASFLVSDSGFYRMIISKVDITRLKQKEAEVLKQSKILGGISTSAAHLLEEQNVDTAINKALRSTGQAFGADRVVLYQFFEKKGVSCYRLSNYWDSEGVDYISHLPQNMVSGKMADSISIRKASELVDGEFAETYLDEVSTEQRELLEEMGEVAALAIPIMSESRLIGTLVLKLTIELKRWTELQKSGGLTVARNIGSALSIFKAKSDLQLLNQNLEQVVQERTAKMEEAIKELESFSYSVSHDLRAPLRAIGGFTEVLERDYRKLFDKKGKHYLDVIKQGSNEMSQLIDDLLDFSKMGRLKLQFSSIDMEQLIREVIRESSDQVLGRDINFHVQNLVPCHGDRAMIKQVAVNLILNAIKYSEKVKTAVIEIGCEKKGELVEYFVKDNGIGFDMRYSDKLFGVFQRLHASEDFDGTGVGLAIVHRIVTRHTGNVRAYGEVNNGATFYFSLPLKVEVPAEEIVE